MSTASEAHTSWLVVGGGWWLVVGGGWWLAVGGGWWSLGAVLSKKKKIWSLKDRPGSEASHLSRRQLVENSIPHIPSTGQPHNAFGIVNNVNICGLRH